MISENQKGQEMNYIMIFIGLVTMCYSFLWIDAKPVAAIAGMIIGLFIIVWGNIKEDRLSDRSGMAH